MIRESEFQFWISFTRKIFSSFLIIEYTDANIS